MWAILFLNTLAGISIISQAALFAQETTHVSAVAAAGLVGIISIADRSGRFLWAWCSDFTGRARVFQVMLLMQAIVFFLLSRVHSFGALAFLAFIVLLCYGGGFGTMPAFAADFFGPRNVGSIYGLMLTAWGFAGLFGPTLIAQVRQRTGYYTEALELIAGIMLLSAVLFGLMILQIRASRYAQVEWKFTIMKHGCHPIVARPRHYNDSLRGGHDLYQVTPQGGNWGAAKWPWSSNRYLDFVLNGLFKHWLLLAKCGSLPEFPDD